MKPSENQRFIAAFRALPKALPMSDQPGIADPRMRVVLRTYMGTLRLYAAEVSTKHEGFAFEALGTLDTLKERSARIESWYVWLNDEPGNPHWSVCSVERVRSEDGATLELVYDWTWEEWHALGSGLRNPDGEPMMGWLDIIGRAVALHMVKLPSEMD